MRVREKNAKGWKQAVSRRMGIQKVEVVQVGMEPVNPGLLAYARTEDKVRKMKVVAEKAARLSCLITAVSVLSTLKRSSGS